MGNSKIEWTEKTWNPITGCTPISEGCQNCYAERMSKRLAGRYGYPADEPFKPGTFHADKLDEPLKWKKPGRIFVCSMGDLFHEAVSFEHIENIFSIMRRADKHTFIVLTKRPRTAKMFLDNNLRSDTFKHWPLPNVWLGVTAENQQTADERIPILLQIPAAVRFVSVEPMLGPVDLTFLDLQNEPYNLNALNGYRTGTACLDWVIAGGETGPGARPMKITWARSLRDQCIDAGVPFFYKRVGNFWDGINLESANRGRLLDGKEWNQYPGWAM